MVVLNDFYTNPVVTNLLLCGVRKALTMCSPKMAT